MVDSETVTGEVVGTVTTANWSDWERLGIWIEGERGKLPSNSAHSLEPGTYKLVRVED